VLHGCSLSYPALSCITGDDEFTMKTGFYYPTGPLVGGGGTNGLLDASQSFSHSF
jgi:hypothetical protein